MIAQILPFHRNGLPLLESTILVDPALDLTCRTRVSLDRLPARTGNHRQITASTEFGDYEILDEIARGGMGVVYRARQKSLDRIVAIKVVLPSPFPSEAIARCLEREARIGARFNHPGIVAVHELGACDGSPFVAMAHVEGENLGTRVKRGALPPMVAAKIVAEVADAIQHVHDCGVLHCDIKPANILIDPAGRTKVVDFGLAREMGESADAPGRIAGTPSYMSPEQAAGRNDQLGPASDVYSLGAVLHELLTGRPPFEGISSREILMKVCHNDLGPSYCDDPSISEGLKEICRRAMHKDATERYASANELANALRREVERAEGGE